MPSIKTGKEGNNSLFFMLISIRAREFALSRFKCRVYKYMSSALKCAHGRSQRLLYAYIATLILSGVAKRFVFIQSAVYPYIPIGFIWIAFCPIFLSV